MHGDGSSVQEPLNVRLRWLLDKVEKSGFTNKLHEQINKVSGVSSINNEKKLGVIL